MILPVLGTEKISRVTQIILQYSFFLSFMSSVHLEFTLII